MKVLVIFTGGTIQSKAHCGVLRPEREQGYDLLKAYLSSSGKDVTFTSVSLLNILSENGRPRHWSKIAQAILEADLASYDGVIVTHGTDTLAYAAAALAYTLTAVLIPVVLVSSNQPLGSHGCNALVNFSNAVTFIRNYAMPGVYVTYCNPDGRSFLHFGTRLTSALPFFHVFRSERDAFVAEFKGESCIFNEGRHGLLLKELRNRQPFPMLAPKFSENILYLHSYPGLDYRFVNLSREVRAVMLGLYHSGTACTKTTKSSLSALVFTRRCNERRIPLYIAPIQSKRGGAIYETSQKLLDAGVVALHDMAPEASLVKVMLGYGNERAIEDVPAFVRDSNVALEVIAPPEEW